MGIRMGKHINYKYIVVSTFDLKCTVNGFGTLIVVIIICIFKGESWVANLLHILISAFALHRAYGFGMLTGYIYTERTKYRIANPLGVHDVAYDIEENIGISNLQHIRVWYWVLGGKREVTDKWYRSWWEWEAGEYISRMRKRSNVMIMMRMKDVLSH